MAAAVTNYHALNSDPKIIIRSRYTSTYIAVLPPSSIKWCQRHKKQSDGPSTIVSTTAFANAIANSVACNLTATHTNQPIDGSIQRIILNRRAQTHNIQINHQPTDKGIIDRIKNCVHVIAWLGGGGLSERNTIWNIVKSWDIKKLKPQTWQLAFNVY